MSGENVPPLTARGGALPSLTVPRRPTIIGEIGDDTILGQQGDDTPFGNFGSALLNGGPGDDFLNGGPAGAIPRPRPASAGGCVDTQTDTQGGGWVSTLVAGGGVEFPGVATIREVNGGRWRLRLRSPSPQPSSF